MNNISEPPSESQGDLFFDVFRPLQVALALESQLSRPILRAIPLPSEIPGRYLEKSSDRKNIDDIEYDYPLLRGL